MRKHAILILIAGGALLAVLVALHWSTGPHAVRRPWLHLSILPVLALTTLATAWYAWKRSARTARMQQLWPGIFIAGGIGFQEGNPATPFLYLLFWILIVVAVYAGVTWYERSQRQLSGRGDR